MMDSDVFYPLFYLAWQLLLLAVLLDMVHRRRTPSAMIAWFLVIFAIPYVGVFFYLFLGRRKLAETPFKETSAPGKDEADRDAAPFESLLRRSGIAPATSGNALSFYDNAVEAYGAVMEAIERAESSIYIATYIFRIDAVTRPMLTLLDKKARAGVDVRLLVDAFGSFPLYLFPGKLRRYEAGGMHTAFFMPLRPFWRNFHFNLRLHRKMFIIDGQTLFAGGMNLSNDYFGTPEHPARWKDMLFRIDGPAAARYSGIFVSDWNFTDETRPLAPASADAEAGGNEPVQVVPSGPDIPSDALYDALIDAFYNATERIWIVTPYFIPDEAMMHALTTARLKGVDVRLVTPERSDHLLFELGRSGYMRELAEHGCDVRLYRKKMLHAKAILVDNAIGVAGSLNLDQRSLFLNYEVVSVFFALASLAKLERWIEALLPYTDGALPPCGRGRSILENIGRVIAPQL